jgi:diguanylate cyclase (GGDEF)-like protein
VTIDQRLLDTMAGGELLAQHWMVECRRRTAAGPLDPSAAADFMRALAAALSRVKEQVPQVPLEADDALLAAGWALAWSSRSTTDAIEQLVSLRAAFGTLLTEPAARPLMDAIHSLLDDVIVGVVRSTITDLERDALLDPLTGLFNRRLLGRNLDLEIGRARRLDRPFTMLFFDVDGLKGVNDRDGHAAGDAVLLALADGLRSVLRQADSAYRIGGDEFVVLLPETTAAAATAVVDRLLAEGAPSCSWGTACYPDDADTAEGLLRSADRQLLARRHERRSASSSNDLTFDP